LAKAKSKNTGNTEGLASLVRRLFLENGELYPAMAFRELKAMGRRTTYNATLRLFYDLRQISLIEFTRSEPGNAPYDRRYYRITPGKEYDLRWEECPHHLLYPASRLGGLNYRQGMSYGRSSEYK
jgi:hypothetical protein